MTESRIKFHRNQGGSIESYGAEFNRRLDRLVGGPDRWDTSKGHGVARIGRTKARVERFETGPEIVGLVIEQLPAYVSAIAALLALWQTRRKNGKNDSSGITIEIDGNRYEGALDTTKDVKRAKKVLRALSGK